MLPFLTPSRVSREIECVARYNIFGRKKLERIRPGWKVLASTGREPVARQLPPWWKVCELFSGVGVYISRVEEGSVAERAGLRPGDTILEVNGTPFRAVTHEEALKVSFYFHFPNQKHFLARVTVCHARWRRNCNSNSVANVYNEVLFFFFFLKIFIIRSRIFMRSRGLFLFQFYIFLLYFKYWIIGDCLNNWTWIFC